MKGLCPMILWLTCLCYKSHKKTVLLLKSCAIFVLIFIKSLSLKGSVLDEFIENNNLSQLIDEPTNIRKTGMSCIDLIITDQPNLFVEFGVHSSLDDHCQHHIIHGKIYVSVPLIGVNNVKVLKLFKNALYLQLLSFLLYRLICNDVIRSNLIRSGNVHENPGPNDCNLKFFHWNLGILTARNNAKISLIEAYNFVFNYDLTAVWYKAWLVYW